MTESSPATDVRSPTGRIIGLDIATGVWCTDWDGQGGDPNRLFDDAYNSPFITSDLRFLQPRFGYPNVGPDFSIGGCTPGVPVP